MTQHAPPTPPEMKDLSADSDLGGDVVFLQHSSVVEDGEAGLVG